MSRDSSTGIHATIKIEPALFNLRSSDTLNDRTTERDCQKTYLFQGLNPDGQVRQMTANKRDEYRQPASDWSEEMTTQVKANADMRAEDPWGSAMSLLIKQLEQAKETLGRDLTAIQKDVGEYGPSGKRDNDDEDDQEEDEEQS